MAQAIIDEAKTKAFDQYTDTSGVTTTDGLTPFKFIGPDGAFELSVPKTDTLSTGFPYNISTPGFQSTFKFNDLDDYNKYTRLVNTQRAEKFSLNVKVNYASETDPDAEITEFASPTEAQKQDPWPR